MPSRILNITNDPHQRHVLLLGDSQVEVSLRYHPTVEMWSIDIIYNGINKYGFKLSLGVLHMRSQNLPFDFIVRDASGIGVDPFRIDDFSSGRCELYIFRADDMEEIRGVPVPV